MLTKIKKIKNFAIYENFDWDVSTRDHGNNIAKFKKLNILYGRNYSGKTSLSRIIRTLETKLPHDKYGLSTYEFTHSGNQKLDNTNLANCPYHVRVYNKDFVEENLKWLSDSDGTIKPFAVLGEPNIALEKEIEEKEKALGSELDKVGLKYDLKIKTEEIAKNSNLLAKTSNSLDEKLKTKANTSIKTNSIYKEITYNIQKIKTDIIAVQLLSPPTLSPEEKIRLSKLLTESNKETISFKAEFKDEKNTLCNETYRLLEAEIKPTETIQKLLNDAILQEWVRTGARLHKKDETHCNFCGNPLPNDLWGKIDAHFNKESETLRSLISTQINKIDTAIKNADFVPHLNSSLLFSELETDFLNLCNKLKAAQTAYNQDLLKLKASLQARETNIFNTQSRPTISNTPNEINNTFKEIEELIEKHNIKTGTIEKDQKAARTTLKYDEIASFIKDIDYNTTTSNIEALTRTQNTLANQKDKLSEEIAATEKDIGQLKNQLKDERKGAEKVNHYLQHHFGHSGLQLSAVDEDAILGVHFRINRSNEIAHNLSEGECSLVAFCYFMAKLEDIEAQNKDLIIWIDDPISSLDSNHIFFVYSLIEAVLAKPIKIANKPNTFRYNQLFISTHSLDFLKYLKRISKPKDDCEYFIIERTEQNSTIKLMPKYLKNYITEFNYLFNQIHKCTQPIAGDNDHEAFYNFGNNLRKFLEAYLFYKYPSHSSTEDKLLRFFGNDQLATDLSNRLYNEQSHLEEIFDRSIKPSEIPEIPKLASYVLNTIKEKDPDQYNSLIESIA